MAKLKAEATTQSDLLEYLAEYSDFSFELAVLKMLREHEIVCDHGGHYVDPVTSKSREFDIRGTKTIEKYRVRMAVECKNIRDNFPILVCSVPRHEDESYHEVALVSEENSRSELKPMLMHRSRARILEVRGEHSLYLSGDPVGKSTVQVGRAMDNSISANDSELYEKWGQSLSSLHEMVEDSYWDGDEDDPLDAYISAAFPFVVVPNGRLWAARYDLNGRCISDPVQVDRCSCFVGKDYKMGSSLVSSWLSISHLEIVTMDGLRSFVERYLVSIEGIQTMFSQEGLSDAYRRAIEQQRT